MSKQYFGKAWLYATLAAGITLTATQCTKEGVNAKLVSRALVETPDSTVFSPFMTLPW